MIMLAYIWQRYSFYDVPIGVVLEVKKISQYPIHNLTIKCRNTNIILRSVVRLMYMKRYQQFQKYKNAYMASFFRLQT